MKLINGGVSLLQKGDNIACSINANTKFIVTKFIAREEFLTDAQLKQSEEIFIKMKNDNPDCFNGLNISLVINEIGDDGVIELTCYSMLYSDTRLKDISGDSLFKGISGCGVLPIANDCFIFGTRETKKGGNFSDITTYQIPNGGISATERDLFYIKQQMSINGFCNINNLIYTNAKCEFNDELLGCSSIKELILKPSFVSFKSNGFIVGVFCVAKMPNHCFADIAEERSKNPPVDVYEMRAIKPADIQTFVDLYFKYTHGITSLLFSSEHLYNFKNGDEKEAVSLNSAYPVLISFFGDILKQDYLGSVIENKALQQSKLFYNCNLGEDGLSALNNASLEKNRSFNNKVRCSIF